MDVCECVRACVCTCVVCMHVCTYTCASTVTCLKVSCMFEIQNQSCNSGLMIELDVRALQIPSRIWFPCDTCCKKQSQNRNLCLFHSVSITSKAHTSGTTQFPQPGALPGSLHRHLYGSPQLCMQTKAWGIRSCAWRHDLQQEHSWSQRCSFAAACNVCV